MAAPRTDRLVLNLQKTNFCIVYYYAGFGESMNVWREDTLMVYEFLLVKVFDVQRLIA